MEFKQVVGNRRSIRYFEPDRPVEKEKIQVILEAVNRSSRAVNADFCKGVVVYRDEIPKETLDQFKTPTTTADMDLAPVHIFFFLDPSYIDGAQDRLKELVDLGALNPSHGWSHAYVDDVVYATVLKAIEADPGTLAYLGAMECGVAMCSGLLAGVDEGLGVLFTAYNGEAVKTALDIPEHWLPAWVMHVGYPAEDPLTGGQRPRRPLSTVFFEGKFGQPWQEIPEVTERLKREGMIQEPIDPVKRRQEVREVSRRLGLPE
jgi:nitroreductase